ncbi:hypothetical protein TorRG33x02_325580, partial [Trema orientale]
SLGKGTHQIVRKIGIKKVARKASKVAKFDSDETKVRFEENIQHWPLGAGKGFMLNDTESMAQPSFIADVIAQHNLRLFCAHPEDPIVPLVREFYANLTDPEEDTVYVGGVQVPLSEKAINAIFGLGDPVDEHSEFVEAITELELLTVLKTVAVARAESNVSSHSAYTCIRSSLNQAAKIWYHFLESRLLPTTHGKIVSKYCVLLLYSILTGKSINVGRIIYDEIYTHAARRSGALFFPSSVTKLCQNARAPYLVRRNHIIRGRLMP